MARKLDKSVKICVICGDRAKGINFNVLTCMSCKAFFRRNALRKKEMKCPFDDACRIDKITRKFCSKCRLKKCFDSGMKKEWILSEEEKRLIRDKIIKNKLRKQELARQQQMNNDKNDNGNRRNGRRIHSKNDKNRSKTINNRTTINTDLTEMVDHYAMNNLVSSPTLAASSSSLSLSSSPSSSSSSTTPTAAAATTKHWNAFNNVTSNVSFSNQNCLEKEFAFIYPESIKYFHSSSPSASSSMTMSNQFTEPSSYSLDALLTYDEAKDEFQYSEMNSDFAKFKVITSDNNNNNNHNNNLEPTGSCFTSSQIPHEYNGYSNNVGNNNNNNVHHISETTLLSINSINENLDNNNNANQNNHNIVNSDSMIMSPINNCSVINKNQDSTDEDTLLPIISDDMDDVCSLRFGSSSISSSLGDCCFLFSNSIDSIDFLDNSSENIDFSNTTNHSNNLNSSENNTSDNNNDCNNINNNQVSNNSNDNNNPNNNNSINILFNYISNSINNDNNSGNNNYFRNNVQYQTTSSSVAGDNSNYQSIPTSNNVSRIVSLSNQNVTTAVPKNTSPSAFEFNNNVNNVVNNTNVNNQCEEDANNGYNSEDFSQYLLHDNDPPLTLIASLKPLSLPSSSSNNDAHNNNHNGNNLKNDQVVVVNNNDGNLTDIDARISTGIEHLDANNSKLSINNFPLSSQQLQLMLPVNTIDEKYQLQQQQHHQDQQETIINDNDYHANSNNEIDRNKVLNDNINFNYYDSLNEISAYKILRKIDFPNNELLLPEQYLILELSNACSILKNPYKRILHAKNTYNHKHNCKITEFFIHRLIRMSKRLHSFSNLKLDDQRQLMKKNIFEILCLRSILLYDPDRKVISLLDDKCKLSIWVDLDIFKRNLSKSDFKRHKTIIQKFRHEWKTDHVIFDLLTAMVLFTPRPDLIEEDKIKKEYLRYTNLLRRYLEIKYMDSQEAKSSFKQLISCLDDIIFLKENVVKLIRMISKSSAIGPLFVQLLDLNNIPKQQVQHQQTIQSIQSPEIGFINKKNNDLVNEYGYYC